jgi:putative hydrolase of the HAD superfamily
VTSNHPLNRPWANCSSRDHTEVSIEWIILDFYGTLARATSWARAEDLLAERGYSLSDEAVAHFRGEGLDGTEHDEHSQSRDHYVAWQRERALAMLASSDVHPGEYEQILELLRRGNSERVIEAYPEVPGTLERLRSMGFGLAVCSNWDWDLDVDVESAGLTSSLDVIVSSAWVGARKPHPRIYRETLEKTGVSADRALFAGDTWGPDVEGPLAMGIRPVYLRRPDHWYDGTYPHDSPSAQREEVPVIAGLDEILDLVRRT